MGERNALAQLILLAAAAVGPDPLPQRLCRAWAEGLETDAVGISLMTHTPYRQLLCASNATALRLEEIQFTVAQGPCVTAAESGSPVLVEDMARQVTSWPLFGAQLREELPDVRAIQAIPLRTGQGVLGCVDLARTGPGRLDREAVAEAVAAAEITAMALLSERHGLFTSLSGSGSGGFFDDLHWAATARAVGVLAAREHLSTSDALAVMRARAFGAGLTLVEITAEILADPA